MEPSTNETPIFSDPTEVARFIEDHDRIGVLVPVEETRKLLFTSLSEILAGPRKRVIRITGADPLAILQETFADLLPPDRVDRNSSEWRDAVLVGLQIEQQSAQQRVAAAKAIGTPIDSFDRDISSWLAAGLRDLFEDPITGASFLIEDKGIFARLATGKPAIRFSEDDFLRPDGIRFLEASRSAQSMLTKLSLASTSQYRAAATRLLNRILEEIDKLQLEVPLVQRIARALQDRGEELLLLLEADAPLDWLGYVVSPIRVVVAATEAGALPDRLTLIQFITPVLEVSREGVDSTEPAPIPQIEEVTQPAPVVQPEDADFAESASALQNRFLTEQARAALFIRRGLLPREAVAEGLVELRQQLADLWRDWFSQQLQDVDAEGFLSHVGRIAGLARNIAAVTTLWEKGEVALRLPASEEDFIDAERAIAELQYLDCERRLSVYTPVEESMAFEAAVAAGGAPLDMLTESVKWWLRQGNKDWNNYRIVRVEEPEPKPI